MASSTTIGSLLDIMLDSPTSKTATARPPIKMPALPILQSMAEDLKEASRTLGVWKAMQGETLRPSYSRDFLEDYDYETESTVTATSPGKAIIVFESTASIAASIPATLMQEFSENNRSSAPSEEFTAELMQRLEELSAKSERSLLSVRSQRFLEKIRAAKMKAKSKVNHFLHGPPPEIVECIICTEGFIATTMVNSGGYKYCATCFEDSTT